MHQHTFLATKLYIPPVRRGLVPRPRLIGRLNAGLRTRDAFARALTLVSAPAGFGKTTLASEWVQTMDGAAPSIGVAWIALDEGDNDLARFLGYLTAALRTVDAGIGKGLQSALQSPQPPPAEVVLISLINDMAALSGRIVLVLDDYHLIDAGPIHDALIFLLEHLPPHLHLVI
ncbi:MAG: LuxR family transcriptional regulator, partial [Anaerolineae bacterium]